MHLVHIALLTLLSVYAVDGLTCLQCDGVPQPRFCSRVVDCYEGEYCSATKVLNEFGEHVYNLGCHTKKVCDNFTSTAKSCSECCATSLCNAEACGQPAYPTKRGPICYNCAVHTDSGPCHDIDFCLDDETCNIVGRQLFSSEVFTSKCISKHACKEQQSGHAAIIGKRDVTMVKRTQQHTCDLCCNHDLCNRNCTTASSLAGPIVIKSCNTNPCGSHGTCVDSVNGYTCLCDIGYEGTNCEKNIDDCIDGLCGSHGSCIDGVNKYTCSCDAGFTGSNCLTNIDDCISQPCSSGGTCYDGANMYTCVCMPGLSGIHCEIDIDDCMSGLCGLHGTCVDGINNYTCACQSGFSGSHCETVHTGIYSDCYDVLHRGNVNQDGVYSITTWKTHREIQVYCDMSTAGGGWTVFQNRFDGSVEFYRNFSEYVSGFGNINGEFWLGLENLHELVSQGQSELRIDVSAANGTKGYEVFQDFDISRGSNYSLHISLGNGTIGDSASDGLSFNNNAAFSTFDHEMDSSSSTHCAESNKGAWWYSKCTNVNLNGPYCTPGTTTCQGRVMRYHRFMGFESLLTSRMMFRRV